MSFDDATWTKRIDGTEGHWRGLEELAGDAEGVEALKSRILSRFPSHFVSRREFVGWMAGLTAVLTSGCTRQPAEKILPYREQPEGLVPGIPQFYASAFVLDGDVQGVLVESHMGRPTKIEGNPDHWGSLGATDRFAQASILGLYDPDRSKAVTYQSVAASWRNFVEVVGKALKTQEAKGGAGIRLLSPTIQSPSLGALMSQFLARYPRARWYRHDAIDREAEREGARLALGETLSHVYRVDQADVILSLDSDFLDSGPGHVRYAREFASRRRAETGPLNRFYALECLPSATGMSADHRWPVTPEELYQITLAIAAELGVAGAPRPKLDGKWAHIAPRIAADLKARAGRALVVPGQFQSPLVHAAAHAMNHALGAVGRTIFYLDPIEPGPASPSGDVAELVSDMQQGRVELLVILDGNPAATMAPGLNFRSALSRVGQTVCLSPYPHETARLCDWQVPQAHYLETWSDVVAPDGSVTIQQPLIRPLYEGRSAQEVLAVLLGRPGASAYEEVRSYWEGRLGAGFESTWRRAVHDGLVPGVRGRPRSARLRPLAFPHAGPPSPSLTLVLRPDPTVWDGRFANNAWLQELPKPVTKVTWENVFHLSPRAAERMKIKNGDVIEISQGGRSLKGPAWITPGQPDRVIGAHLGYGLRYLGRVAEGSGFDAFWMRTADRPWAIPGIEVKPTGARARIACTQSHWSMEGRDPVKTLQWDGTGEPPRLPRHGHGSHDEDELAAPPPGHGLAPGSQTGVAVGGDYLFTHPDYAWGMVIDLSACNGCNACVVGCQAENNVPVVGKDEVLKEREMHWLRIDRYFDGPADNPRALFQPLPCMHCEKAPCEVVCPVNATTHSPEGINEMTYNRCVGTKYCANNCPYKVRRFNFFRYADVETPQIRLGRNPDVTVRGRGVMEKCTFCVQRVNAATIDAKKEGRKVREGEIQTACQQACPSEAIVFGNLKDPESRVSQLRKLSRHYALLDELGTRPRTTYLARVSNPHPEIERLEREGRA